MSAPLFLRPTVVAALGVLGAGATFGALLGQSVEAMGGSLETISIVISGSLVGHLLGRLWRARHQREILHSSLVAFSALLLAAGDHTPAALTSIHGWLDAPRILLPLSWMMLMAGITVILGGAPVPNYRVQGVLAGFGLVLGLALPGPVVGMLAAGCALIPRPPEHQQAPGTREIPAGIATAATVAVGVQAVAAVSPSLDPSLAPSIAALVGIAVGLPYAWARGKRSNWTSLLVASFAAALVSLLLPHSVGIVRVVHSSITLPLPFSAPPSLAAMLVMGVAGVVWGGALGLAAGPRRWGHAQTIGALVGLLLGQLPLSSDGTHVLAIAGGTLAIVLVACPDRLLQVGAISLFVPIGLSIWLGASIPTELLAQSTRFGLRDATSWEAMLQSHLDAVPGTVVLGTGATGVVTAAPEDWGANGRVGAAFVVDLAGRRTRPLGRAAEAETMAGMLAGLLAPRLDRILVLGDDAGNAFAGVTSAAPSVVDISTPAPWVVKDLAQLSSARRDRWLAPGVRLWPDHPSVVLRRAPEPAAIVEVSGEAWFDNAHAAPTFTHLARVHQRLGKFGVYVLVLHLESLRPGVAAGIAADVARVFQVVQAWLPPSGAESLILVATDTELPLKRLEGRYATVQATARDLGFPNPAALASNAVGDRASIRTWTNGFTIEPRIPTVLDPGVRLPPRLPLAAFAAAIALPEATWDLTDAETGAPALASRLDNRRRFLELIGDAARGDVASAFGKAHDLAGEDGGERALQTLVGPHLAQARAALARAMREGQSSPAWADVQRYATTARMIAPTSAEPLVLLGTLAMAQGNLNEAHDRFTEAARLAPGDLEALTGLARVERARRNAVNAEHFFREAATANPREWLAWHRLGAYLTEVGRTDEAEDILERAVGLAEGRTAAPNLALVRLYLSTGRPSPALVHAERAVVIDATADAWFLRGQTWLALEQRDRAEEDFRKAVLADPNFAVAHGEIGRIRAAKGDYAAAEEAWKAVLRIEPNNADARENLRRLGAEERQQAASPASTATTNGSAPTELR